MLENKHPVVLSGLRERGIRQYAATEEVYCGDCDTFDVVMKANACSASSADGILGISLNGTNQIVLTGTYKSGIPINAEHLETNIIHETNHKLGSLNPGNHSQGIGVNESATEALAEIPIGAQNYTGYSPVELTDAVSVVEKINGTQDTLPISYYTRDTTYLAKQFAEADKKLREQLGKDVKYLFFGKDSDGKLSDGVATSSSWVALYQNQEIARNPMQWANAMGVSTRDIRNQARVNMSINAANMEDYFEEAFFPDN